jgi:hypothetical protein
MIPDGAARIRIFSDPRRMRSKRGKIGRPCFLHRLADGRTVQFGRTRSWSCRRAYRGVLVVCPRYRMIPLSTLLQLFHALAVAAFVALAAVHSSAQSNAQISDQPSTPTAALGCIESPLASHSSSASLFAWRYSDPQAALDLEETEREGDQEVPPLDVCVHARPRIEPLLIFASAEYHREAVVDWASAPVSCRHPRGPPVR